MPSIFLVRHCEYANPRNILVGRLPVELSEYGLQQAKKLGAFFADKSITNIYSSAVLRCKQTSEMIASALPQKPPIQFDRRLLESLSAYQGYWFENGKELDWTHFFSHQNEVGGETYADIAKRVSSFWDEVVLSAHGNTIVCSHGDELFLMYLYAMDRMDELKQIESLNDIEAVLGENDYQRKGTVREVVVDMGGKALSKKIYASF